MKPRDKGVIVQTIVRIVETNDAGDVEVLLTCGHRRSVSCSSTSRRFSTLRAARCHVCTRAAQSRSKVPA